MVDNRAFIRPVHKVLIALSFVMIIASIVVVIVFACTHEAGEVATHYDINGNPDDYSNPMGFVILPIIMLITNAIMALMLRYYPLDKWNYPIKVNPTSAALVYTDSVWLMILLMLLISIYCFGMSLAIGNLGKVGMWASLLLVGLLVLIVVTLMVKMIRDNKKII